jgi:hypothetical protein
MISHEFKCIFIHIPKTAGSSIEQKLKLFDTLEWGLQDHRTIMELEPELKRYRNYFKFSVVRNPWSRAFSWYNNVLRDERHRIANKIPYNISFKDYLITYENEWALMPQLNWLKNSKGKIPIDFICRFENLKDDFSFVCNQLGIKDKSLPTLLKFNYSNYRLSYDEELIDLVSKRYKEEIEYFQFEFNK